MAMRHDIYAFAAPRDLSVEQLTERLEAWEGAGGEPATAPFEPSSDVAGFYREIEHDLRGIPGFGIVADATPHTGRGPVWLQTEPAPPAHVAALRLPRGTPDALTAVLDDVYGTAAKFDVMLFDANRGVLHEPLAAMGAHADATFWPGGAVRGIVVGSGGLVAVIAAWVVGIPLVSGVVVIVGGFLFALAALTLVAETRKRLRRQE
jgi:hypothetical protein